MSVTVKSHFLGFGSRVVAGAASSSWPAMESRRRLRFSWRSR